MKIYLWVALGSALGGMARHWVGNFAAARFPSSFPWGTFAVNVLGAFAIGLLAGLPEARVAPAARAFLMVGVLGGFTTFSAFSLQTASLFTGGRPGVAFLYLIASAAACPFLAWLGWRAVRGG